MKIAFSIAVIVIVLAVWIVARSRAQSSSAETKKESEKIAPAPPTDVYLGLRNKMLHGSRAEFGLPPGARQNDPWGVLMDWGVEKGTVTVVAVSDGSASVYFSSGGGFIGGKGQEPIRKAAQHAAEVARALQPSMRTSTSQPLPQRGRVVFYLLTDAGVFTADTTEQELNSTDHPLRKLGDAMQEVITQYRLWSEEQKRVQSK